MDSYNNITVWENSRRLRALNEFRNDVLCYFEHSQIIRRGLARPRRIEHAEASEARRRINHSLVQVQHFMKAAGVAASISIVLPASGGYEKQIDVIANLFRLHQLQIPGSDAVSLIEQAEGVYRSDRPSALRRTLNPLWWLYRGFLWILRIPFVVLGAVGFDAARAEASVWGKAVKLLVAVSALLQILNLLGGLPAAKSILGIG